MKSSIRALGLAIAGFGLIGLVGCAENNDKEVLNDTPRSKVTTQENAPQNQQDMYKMQQQQGTGAMKDYRSGARTQGR